MDYVRHLFLGNNRQDMTVCPMMIFFMGKVLNMAMTPMSLGTLQGTVAFAGSGGWSSLGVHPVGK